MMAKTSRPLVILVHESIWDDKEIVKLRAKGNVVHTLSMDGYPIFRPFEEYDLVIGPNCWRTLPGMNNMIEMAIKSARRVKYGKAESKGHSGKDTDQSSPPEPVG